MTTKQWVRVGLVYLVSYQLIVGIWQYAFPHSFYVDVPTVSNDPPYNEHLMSDVGGLGLAIATVLAFALYHLEHRLVCAAVAANFVYALTHFAFHATHLEGWDRADATTVATVLGMNVLVPLAVWLAARRIRHELT